MSKTAKARIMHAVKTGIDWTKKHFVLLKGEIGIETTDNGVYAKVGDGESGFSALPYLSNPVLEQTAEYLQEQIDNINGVPVVQIVREDGGVIYLKETNLNVEHVYVSTDAPENRGVIWIKPQEDE